MYNRYEEVLAAQVEIPPAIVVKQTSEEAETDIATPMVIAQTASTAETTTETTTETTSIAAAVTVETAAPQPEVLTQEIAVAEDPVITEPVPVVPTLNEFLSQFRCGGCGKNCSLLNPRCGVGNQKAQQAESEYYATYS